jgi:hypothetical protein
MATNANGFWDPLAPKPKDSFAMTPAEHAALLLAPKKPAPKPSGPGTTVTVRAYPVAVSANLKDHMFESYDDGRSQYIYRAGPDWPNSPFIRAQATPAPQSPDYGKGTRVIDQEFLPGLPAKVAFHSAEQDARAVNRRHPVYGVIDSNSNSVAADHWRRKFGRTPGDELTPGYLTTPRPLPFGPPLDLSRAILGRD